MNAFEPGPLRLLAATTTPVVVAALLGFVVLASGCEAGWPIPSTHEQTAPPGDAATATFAPGDAAGGLDYRLVMATGLSRTPVLTAHDPGGAGGSRPIALPADLRSLAALASAPDGTLAIVDSAGRAWLTSRASDASDEPRWQALGPPSASGIGGSSASVLGAAWAPDGSALFVTMGSPGAARPRTAIVVLARDGTGGRAFEIGREADGPGLAALPDGELAVVLRDRDDQARLARVTAAGEAMLFDRPARAVASGGGLLAVADDDGVVVGRAGAAAAGALPADPLPLVGGLGIGPVAVSPDGRVVAVVRLDDQGNAVRVDLVRREAGGWIMVADVKVVRRPGGVAVAWWGTP